MANSKIKLVLTESSQYAERENRIGYQYLFEDEPLFLDVYITPVMRLGALADLIIALQGLAFSGRLNTAFSERVKLTVRHRVPALARHMKSGQVLPKM